VQQRGRHGCRSEGQQPSPPSLPSPSRGCGGDYMSPFMALQVTVAVASWIPCSNIYNHWKMGKSSLPQRFQMDKIGQERCVHGTRRFAVVSSIAH
jgi:hypothetical protein